MSVAIVSGSGGLVGSECVRHFSEAGFDVVGIDNDMRKKFFGDEASTARSSLLLQGLYDNFRLFPVDIRDGDALKRLFRMTRPELVVHAAAQPAHDWAARDPVTDFGVNAVGTLNMLEAAREYAREATFVHCSTSKVYGDNPNRLPLVALPTRMEPPEGHRYWWGIDTTMSIDQCTHSLFGASKAAGDLLVQEYGRYFDMPTVCFRPGCISGPKHAGAELHGFLSYLVKCVMTGAHYRIYGYGGRQVRCNVHAADLADAFHEFHRAPRAGAVYNIGGGRESNCSMREAIHTAEVICDRGLDWTYFNEPRIGDHIWWISDNRPFKADYPDWAPRHNTASIVQEIHDYNAERWAP